MSEFTFNENTHKYFLDGKPMTGVTTVLGVINKPALVAWSAKMACEYVRENLKNIDDLESVLELAKGAHNRFRDNAADAGTDVHAECEKYINLMITDQGGVAHLMNDDGQNAQVKAFIQWAVDNKIKFLASEKKVYSATHFTAGTLDFACEIDGIKYIGDIKTTSGIYDRTPFAQTAAYQMMWAEMEGKEPSEIAERRIIVNLKKTGTFDPDKDVYISQHYEDDIELFMSALTMYRNVGRFAPLNYLAKRK
jgi:hypothetical protein